MKLSDNHSRDAAAKAELCALLARLFAAELDADLYVQLRAVERPTFIWFEPTLLQLPQARALELLVVEYCGLFIGPQALCPPYALAQRGEAMLGGGALTRLAAFMAAHAVPAALQGWRIASPDHIAVEFTALVHLYANGVSPDVVREFLKQHLLPWAPAFLADVDGYTERRLYRTAAQLGIALLAEENMST